MEITRLFNAASHKVDAHLWRTLRTAPPVDLTPPSLNSYKRSTNEMIFRMHSLEKLDIIWYFFTGFSDPPGKCSSYQILSYEAKFMELSIWFEPICQGDPYKSSGVMQCHQCIPSPWEFELPVNLGRLRSTRRSHSSFGFLLTPPGCWVAPKSWKDESSSVVGSAFDVKQMPWSPSASSRIKKPFGPRRWCAVIQRNPTLFILSSRSSFTVALTHMETSSASNTQVGQNGAYRTYIQSAKGQTNLTLSHLIWFLIKRLLVRYFLILFSFC